MGTVAAAGAKPNGNAADRERERTPSGHLIVRDERGHQIRLGIMQQWIVDFLARGPQPLEGVSTEIKEPVERARTRLRQLAARGVTVLGPDGLWRLAEGPAAPAEPPPFATRATKSRRAASA